MGGKGLSGKRVKRNEEIKRYRVNFSTMEAVPTEYCLPSDVSRLESDITLMIEQMGGMKDEIERLTKERDEAIKLLSELERYFINSLFFFTIKTFLGTF